MTDQQTQPSNASPLPEILLFGFTKPCVYMIRGKSVNGVYHLALEVTDHTDEGTYASAFSLDSLTKYWDEELDIAPNDAAVTLKWLKTAFGVSGGNAARPPKWIPTNRAPGQSPQLETLYQPLLDDQTSKETLSLPPKKFPLLGNLTPKLANEVRASITNAAIQKQIATEAKLAECEKQKKKLAVAAEAVRELREDGDTRIEQILAMMRKLNGGLNALEADEHEEEEEKKAGGAVDTPPSTEKPLRAASQSGAAGRRKPSLRKPQSRFATGNAGKGRKGGDMKVLGIKK